MVDQEVLGYGEQADEPISALLTAAKVEELPPVPDLPVAQVEELPVAGHKYVLKNGDSEFDLRPLTDAELHAFAAANEIKVHAKAKGDTIRDKIVEALTAEG